MLSIRLSRVGTKKAPVYRIVVMPKHRDPWANSLEILGHYNPRMNPRELVLKVDRVKHWISVGAQPTDTVWNLLVDEKIVEGKKRGASHLTKKRKGKMEEKVAEDKAKAEAAATKVKEEAEAKAAAEVEAKAKAKEEAEAKAKAESEAAKEAEATTAEAPAEEPSNEEAPTEEVSTDEASEEKEETPAE
jgi:small subunit ribosomal protein S16